MADPPDLHTVLGAAPIRRDVLHVRGPDAVGFLQGQLSQDIAALAVGESVPSLLLEPTGKVDAWLRVTRLGDQELLLDVDAGYGDAVHARLRRFKLRTDVDFEPAEWAGLALRGPGADSIDAPHGALALRAVWPGVPGLDIVSDGDIALAGVPLVDREALDALRIECGVPAMGAELTESTIPAEAGAWLIEASVSFTKGCYTGQELVARIDSRGGNVPHPVRGLLVEAEEAPVGAEVIVQGATVGHVTSVGRSGVLGAIGLCVVGRTATPGQRVELRWHDARCDATLAELPLR